MCFSISGCLPTSHRCNKIYIFRNRRQSWNLLLTLGSFLLPFLSWQKGSAAPAASNPGTTTAATCCRPKRGASPAASPWSPRRWVVCAAAAAAAPRPTWWPRSVWSACCWSSSSSSSSAGPRCSWWTRGRRSTGARPTAWPGRPSPSSTCCPTPRPASTPSSTASWTSASARACCPPSAAAAASGGAPRGGRPGALKWRWAERGRRQRPPSRTVTPRRAEPPRASTTPASARRPGASWPRPDWEPVLWSRSSSQCFYRTSLRAAMLL